MGLESVKWDGKNYHAYVWPDEPRNSYIYDEDANGAFYIRNSDNIENDCISEYVYVHFALKTPLTNNDIYINGVWTNNQFIPEYRMTYNSENGLYENILLLKQGYYSYNYLIRNEDGSFTPLQTEGNFCYTENKYQCLVYYKAAGDRTDTLGNLSRIVENKTKNSKKAVLKYKVLKTEAGRSLLEIHLKTGRHHQIRAQLAYAGWPILGDTKYNDKRPGEGSWQEMGLCASRLSFLHPATGKKMEFQVKPDGNFPIV